MTQTEYEQKRTKCWEEFKRQNLDGEVQWQPVSRYDVFCAAFDSGFALGKEKETITQEEIEKVSVEFADREYEIGQVDWDALYKGYSHGMKDSLGKQEKDAEGEEMLTVPRNKVQEQYALNVNALREGNLTDMQIEIATKVKDTLYYLFSSKCLPDKACNVASSDVASSEPKFTKEDMVHCKSFGYEGDYKVIEYVGGSSKCYDCIDRNGYHFRFYESDLEPYTEPEKEEYERLQAESVETLRIASEESHLRNLSQNIADCDKQFDNILKDGFLEHNRLYIAAMAMQGILSNQQLLKIAIEAYQEETGSPDMYVAVAKAAKAQADALIAESEKGGPYVRDKS